MFAATACPTTPLVVKQGAAKRTTTQQRRVTNTTTTSKVIRRSSTVSRAAVASAAVAMAAGGADANAPAIIVGGGRVGQALGGMGVAGDVVLKRGDAFPATPATGPIFVVGLGWLALFTTLFRSQNTHSIESPSVRAVCESRPCNQSDTPGSGNPTSCARATTRYRALSTEPPRRVVRTWCFCRTGCCSRGWTRGVW
jgi:hypothetical protein